MVDQDSRSEEDGKHQLNGHEESRIRPLPQTGPINRNQRVPLIQASIEAIMAARKGVEHQT